MKRPRNLKTFEIFGCLNPPLLLFSYPPITYCVFATLTAALVPKIVPTPSRRGLIERGQGADSQPSSVGGFLSAGCPQPLPRWLQMNLPWQAYPNQTSCSGDPRRLPGAQSGGFKDREADPTPCLEIITQACPPFSLSSPQPVTPACNLWPPIQKRVCKERRE